MCSEYVTNRNDYKGLKISIANTNYHILILRFVFCLKLLKKLRFLIFVYYVYTVHQQVSTIQGESKKTDTFDIEMNNKGVSFF